MSVRSSFAQKSDFIVKKIVNRESGFRMKRGLQFSALLVGTCLALPAFADDTEDKPDPALGLSPGSPEGTVLPGGMTPAFGQHPKDEQDWRFDFHGFFSMNLPRKNVRLQTGVSNFNMAIATLPDSIIFRATKISPFFAANFVL